ALPISTQESTLRHISRELHDEFGQILTAVGMMLTRAGNQAPEKSELRAELREVCEITQNTLDKVRSLSQALHPVMQEALNNLTRHSGASEAWVRLRFLPHTLEIEVEDHGKGFEAQAATQGIGLVAMRERAELLGGTVQFLRPAQGQDGRGTLVRLRVPREK